MNSVLPDLSKEEIARYSRHLILDEVGMEGQRKLKAASVLCVGTGGLGSPLLMYLAAAGVGRIGIVDFDVVDASNLQRQIIHGTASIGVSKVQSAKARILDINPNIQVDVYEDSIRSDNALEMMEPYDVIVDGTDNFPTRYLINDACVILGKPNVYGSIFRFEGQVTVFNLGDGPHYRDLYPEPPPPGLVPSCAEGGVLGILPGVVGALQATETIKVILGLGTTLSGRLLRYDALHMTFKEFKLRKHPDTPPITELIDYEFFCGFRGEEQEELMSTEDKFARLSVGEIKQKLDGGWKPYVLDVRKPHEADIAKLSFADRLQPHEQVADILGELPKDREILVHCKMGGRSAAAAAVLADAGFKVTNMEGGITAWANEIDDSIATY